MLKQCLSSKPLQLVRKMSSFKGISRNLSRTQIFKVRVVSKKILLNNKNKSQFEDWVAVKTHQSLLRDI